MRAWLAIALVSLAPAAATADKPQDALKLLDEGIREFNGGQLAEAREAFSRARELVPDKANPYRWLGLVDARMGHCGDAIKELDIFLQKVPPNDQRVAEAVTLRDRCREDLQPRVGALVVESSPPGADVRIDDGGAPSVGTTPYRNDAVPAGNHVVFLQKPGYQSVTRGVAISPRETAQLELALTPTGQPAERVSSSRHEAPLLVTKSGSEPPRKKKPYWVAGLVIGVLVAGGVAVGLGIGLTQSSVTEFPHVGPPGQ